MKNINLNYFWSTRANGNMNKNKAFYPGMTPDEITRDFDERRIQLCREHGIDELKIIIPTQKIRPVLTGKTDEEKELLLQKYNSKYSDGHYVRITHEMIEPYEDLYKLDVPADILMIDSSIKNVALAYPVADCPVVFAHNTKDNIVAMAHCGGEYIDRDLPGQIIDAMREETDCKPYDISVYIGPHAQESSFTYDCFPKFIENERRWEGCLREANGLIHINMSKAIMMQLMERGVHLETVHVSALDTITNPDFYSNNRARLDESKAGRFYTGCFYNSKIKELTKTR